MTARPARRHLPLRLRILLLILVASVPLLGVAGVLAWHNSRLILDASMQRAEMRRQAVLSRIQAIAEATGGLLAALPASERAGPDCPAVLQRIVASSAGRTATILSLDGGGRVLCQGGEAADLPPGAGAGWSRLAKTFRGAQLGTALPAGASDTATRFVVPVIQPVRDGAVFAGALVALVPVRVLLQSPAETPGLAWLLERDGKVVPVGDSRRQALPSEPELQHFRAPGTVASARAAGGGIFAYVTLRIAPDTDVLLAQPMTEAEAAVRSMLLRRFAGLVALLMLAAAIVAAGADRLVVSPVTRLSRAVGRWRAGADFSVANSDAMPEELRELAHSFAEATGALRRREIELREATEQQHLLMQEIHHRVKNNLQIIASLLNLQAGRIRQPEARAEFASARDRVRALATLHRHLYAQGDLHTVNMRGFLIELCAQLFQAMGEREGNRIRLDIQASDLQMSSDQAVPMALIVTEAVSNALKYAFPGNRRGRIAIRLAREGEMARLEVEDDGIGIPPGPAETETGRRDGIGLQLIRGFARQLGATLECRQNGGTHYIVKLPLKSDRPSEQAGKTSGQEVTPA
jgi:two-component sensor histidine kinase